MQRNTGQRLCMAFSLGNTVVFVHMVARFRLRGYTKGYSRKGPQAR